MNIIDVMNIIDNLDIKDSIEIVYLYIQIYKLSHYTNLLVIFMMEEMVLLMQFPVHYTRGKDYVMGFENNFPTVSHMLKRMNKHNIYCYNCYVLIFMFLPIHITVFI